MLRGSCELHTRRMPLSSAQMAAGAHLRREHTEVWSITSQECRKSRPAPAMERLMSHLCPKSLMTSVYSRANESACTASPTAIRDARFGLERDAAFLLKPCTMYPLSSRSSARYDLHKECQQVGLLSPGAMYRSKATGLGRTRLDPIRL